MQSNHIMAIVIVAIVMFATVMRPLFGGGKSRRDRTDGARDDDAETQRLREEVRQLKERLQVLERITVEKENSLEREIERLRDH